MGKIDYYFFDQAQNRLSEDFRWIVTEFTIVSGWNVSGQVRSGQVRSRHVSGWTSFYWNLFHDVNTT